VEAGGLRPDGGGPGPAKDPVRIRRLAVGILLAAPGGCADGLRAARGAQGPGVSGRSDRTRADHYPALRPLDAPGVPGDAGARSADLRAPGAGRRRGAAAAAHPPLRLASRPCGAPQPVRSDRGLGGRDLLARSKAFREAGRERADRPADREPPPLCGGPVAPGAAGGSSGRVAARRPGSRARLSRPAGPDGGGVHPRSVRAGKR